MLLPPARGPLSGAVVAALRGAGPVPARWGATGHGDELTHDEDIQLTLWMCYELHYRGFADVDPDWDTDPELLALRTSLERPWLTELRRPARVDVLGPAHVPIALRELVAADDGPPLAKFLQRSATREQFREFVAHRSIYHLKEADPHSWAIPRLDGGAKAALVEIQADEYGGGRLERMHSELFRATMRGLGLADGYGYYLDRLPGCTLAISNLISLFGLHRRWRGALAGHLAVFEMTSTLPNSRYARGLRRLGGSTEAARYYDEHVEADAVHEQVAAFDLCGALAQAEPELAPDILFGGAAALVLDAACGHHLLTCWEAGRSSLR